MTRGQMTRYLLSRRTSRQNHRIILSRKKHSSLLSPVFLCSFERPISHLLIRGFPGARLSSFSSPSKTTLIFASSLHPGSLYQLEQRQT